MYNTNINRAVHQALGECLGTSFSKKFDPFAGDVHLCDGCGGRIATHADPLPDYATDLNAAFRFADRLIAGDFEFSLEWDDFGKGFWSAKVGRYVRADFDHPATAVCLAGLAALGIDPSLNQSEQTATQPERKSN